MKVCEQHSTISLNLQAKKLCEICEKDAQIAALMKAAVAMKALIDNDPVRCTALLIRSDLLEDAEKTVEFYESTYGEIK